MVLRAVRDDDCAALTAILAEPAVAHWWGAFDQAKVRAELIEPDPALEDVVVFAVEFGGEVVGAIQYSENDDPMYRHAGIDLFLATRVHGQGLGSDAIRAVARELFARGHHRIVIDPAADNAGAIRAYERVGFRRVGVMRKYERGLDGSFHDGLMMELLVGELR